MSASAGNRPRPNRLSIDCHIRLGVGLCGSEVHRMTWTAGKEGLDRIPAKCCVERCVETTNLYASFPCLVPTDVMAACSVPPWLCQAQTADRSSLTRAAIEPQYERIYLPPAPAGCSRAAAAAAADTTRTNLKLVTRWRSHCHFPPLMRCRLV